MYSWGNQAKYGDNIGEKPSKFDFIGTLKWDGWTKLKGTPKPVA